MNLHTASIRHFMLLFKSNEIEVCFYPAIDNFTDKTMANSETKIDELRKDQPTCWSQLKCCILEPLGKKKCNSVSICLMVQIKLKIICKKLICKANCDNLSCIKQSVELKGFERDLQFHHYGRSTMVESVDDHLIINSKPIFYSYDRNLWSIRRIWSLQPQRLALRSGPESILVSFRSEAQRLQSRKLSRFGTGRQDPLRQLNRYKQRQRQKKETR